ncbi:DNA mismatch repair protein [Dissophora globulifera]|nr:DNA mismatch repair protein [Dissophora globulifera]
MSLVDIVSRPQNQEQLYSTIFKGGERLFCGRSSKQPKYSHGTTVSVRDLFYKFPVRQRYWSEASTSKLELELDKVRRAVETLALVCPSISFTVIDMVKDSKVLVCRKVDSQLHRITAVLGQSISSSLTYITSDARETTYRLFGYVSTVGHYNRLYQFIFLNGRPIISESLQRAVTQVFQQSTFSKDSIQLDEDTRRSRERCPVFVLNLACPTTSYDICVDPSKVTVEFEEEERVIYVVRDTIIAFLERQHLLSRSAAEVLRNQTTTRKRKSRAGSAIGFSEAALPTGHGSHGKTSRPSKTSKSSQHQDGVQDEIDLEDEIEFELDSDWMASMLDDDFVSSEVEYRRHDDSGIMLPSSDKRALSMRITLPHACGPRPRHFSTGTSSIWAQDALRKWVNPVFPSSPIDIPTLQTLSLDSALGTGDGVRGEPIAKSISRFFALDGLTGHQNSIDWKKLQLSKSCLQHARVIAQLDRKFILCTMKASITADQDGARPRVLVVIDQHAADERVRVERLMKEMCSCSCPTLLSHSGNLEGEYGSQHHAHRLDSMDMIPPLSITLSKREWRLASQYSAWLSRWGIVLDHNGYSTTNGMQNNEHLAEDVDMGETDVDTVTVSHHFERSGGSSLGGRADSTSQLSSQHPEQLRNRASTQPSTLDHSKGWITALPRVVADRCVVDGTLTQDLVRDTISWGEETRYSGRNSLNDDDHGDSKSVLLSHM